MSSRGSGSGFALRSVYSEKDRRDGLDCERRRPVSSAGRVAAVFCLRTLIGRRGICRRRIIGFSIVC